MPEFDPMTPGDIGFVIKARVREAVRLGGGGTFISGKIGISVAHLSKVASPQYPDQLRPDLIPLIEREARSPVVTEALADMQGYRLVQGAKGQDGIATLDDLARLISTSGDFMSSFSSALADRVVDAHERRVLNKGMENLICELRKVQEKINGGGV